MLLLDNLDNKKGQKAWNCPVPRNCKINFADTTIQCEDLKIKILSDSIMKIAINNYNLKSLLSQGFQRFLPNGKVIFSKEASPKQAKKKKSK
ncbi:hypothetical protein ACFLZ2_03960 [Candidatus Margulisiibacteriota bacterium]